MLRLASKLAPLLLTLAACAPLNKPKLMPAEYIDAKLGGYLDDFLLDAKAHGKEVPAIVVGSLRVMRFVEDMDAQKAKYGQPTGGDEDTVGTCASLDEVSTLDAGVRKLNLKEYEWREIWISRPYVQAKAEGLPDLLLKELVYHELGHCLLQRKHAASKPHKIMSPEMTRDLAWVRANWPKMLDELFAD